MPTAGHRYMFMYDYVFVTISVYLPFSEFEVDLMNHLWLAPSQIHPRRLGIHSGF